MILADLAASAASLACRSSAAGAGSAGDAEAEAAALPLLTADGVLLAAGVGDPAAAVFVSPSHPDSTPASATEAATIDAIRTARTPVPRYFPLIITDDSGL
ncbi:hypothetical protein GCM10010442_79560 [Kitasatospora kifunensis]